MWLHPEIIDSDVKIVTQTRNDKKNQKIVIINTSPVCCSVISLPTLSLWSSEGQTLPSIALAPCRHENLPNCHGLHLCSSYCNVKNNTAHKPLAFFTALATLWSIKWELQYSSGRERELTICYL